MAKKYWFTLEFADGSSEDETNEGHGYDTYEEAEEEAIEWISNYHAGNEVLNLSDPGDWPLDEEEVEYTIYDDEEDVIMDLYSN